MGRFIFLGAVTFLAFKYISRSNKKHLASGDATAPVAIESQVVADSAKLLPAGSSNAAEGETVPTSASVL